LCHIWDFATRKSEHIIEIISKLLWILSAMFVSNWNSKYFLVVYPFGLALKRK